MYVLRCFKLIDESHCLSLEFLVDNPRQILSCFQIFFAFVAHSSFHWQCCSGMTSVAGGRGKTGFCPSRQVNKACHALLSVAEYFFAKQTIH